MVSAAACASWYWPFGGSEDGTKPPRISELLEEATEMIDRAAEYSDEGKIDEAVAEYRRALVELDRVEYMNPARAETAEFTTVRNKRAYVNAAIDSLLLKQAHVTVDDRKVVPAALTMEKQTGMPAAAIELPDGRIITGKTSDLLGPSSALLLNSLKELAGIPHEIHVISPDAIRPIQELKIRYLGSKNPRLHMDETMIALSVSASEKPLARKALDQLSRLKGCQAHSSVMLTSVDLLAFRKLGIDVTCEPKFEKHRIYH